MTYLMVNCGRSARRTGSEVLEWQQRGLAEQGGPARSVVSQATPDVVGCSSTLATVDGTFPSEPGGGAVKGWGDGRGSVWGVEEMRRAVRRR
jgi:hypothetical protein